MAYINRLTPKMIAKITRLMKEEGLPNKVLAARFEMSVTPFVAIRSKYAPETIGVSRNPSGLAKGANA